MNYLYIILTVCSLTLQSAIRKSYGKQLNGKGTCVFNGFACLMAALFFWTSGGFQFAFHGPVIIWALVFGVFFGTATYASLCALQIGPMSLTSLAISYSLMIATLYGILFRHEKISIWTVIGLLLLAVSLVFITVKKDEKKISLRWVILALIALISNGICTIVQREQQIAFEGNYKNEFMMVALVAVFAVFWGMSMLKERHEMKTCLKKGAGHMVLWGIANGAANLFVMILATRMPASLMYPLISGGSIILTWLTARFFYKDQLSVLQNWGLVLGTGAVVLLNI